MILRNEFSLYDPLLVNLRDNYLLEASQILLEALPYQKNQPVADASWYIKWKGDCVVTLKNSFSKFKEYALRQNLKYSKWLRNNREYFDARKYNPGTGCSISSAPNYTEAIERIRKPISVLINGEALNRIAIPDKANDQSVDNRWFYKTLIPEYTGTGDDYLRYAKMYYNGLDKKRSISTKAMATYIPIMYSYCINYSSLVQQLEGQLNSIISFINRDPISGISNTSDSAVKQLQNQQQQNANNKYASTNPNNNVVNASVDYHLYQEACIVLNELGSNIPNVNKTNQVKNSFMTNTSKTANTTKNVNTVKNNNAQNNPNLLLTNKLNQSKMNQKQLAMKKKQTASNIVKDTFLCKITAANIIYRDFITTLQVWTNGVQEQIQKSNQRIADKKARELERNQKQAQ